MVACGDHSSVVRKWGFVTTTGELAIPFQFDHADTFSEGLATVNCGENDGCVDHTGIFVIPPEFDAIGPFHNGVSPACRDGKYGYVNRSGQFVIAPIFDFADSFYTDIAKVKLNHLIGFIDRNGQLLIPPRFEFAEFFSDGYSAVADPDNFAEKWYVDRTGQAVFGPFQAARSFSEGLAAVCDEDGCRYIDTKGKVAFCLPPLVYGYRFSDGVASAADHSNSLPRTGYIDRRGEWIIPAQFDFSHNFHNGVAVVDFGKKKGLIDKSGRFVLRPTFDDLDELHEERIKFAQGGRFGFLDDKGGVVIEPAYYSAQRFSEGLAPVCIEIDSV